MILRIYYLKQWYQLSDTGAEGVPYDNQSMRAFCKLKFGRNPIPDEMTILNFGHLIGYAWADEGGVLEAVADHLEARGALLRGGTCHRALNTPRLFPVLVPVGACATSSPPSVP